MLSSPRPSASATKPKKAKFFLFLEDGTASTESENDLIHVLISTTSFSAIMLLFLCLFIGLIIHKYHVYALPEAAASMIVGFVVGVFCVIVYPDSVSRLQFNPAIFFFILLPPIIFEAGYTLKRSDFFLNLGAILTYAVLGTCVATFVFGFLLFLTIGCGLVPLDDTNPIEALQFGACISATDVVATIAILSSAEFAADPLLYSLVFGESVLNDAVAIVLYKTFGGFHGSAFSWSTIFEAVVYFFGVAVGSAAVGIVIALVCCRVFKKFDFSDYPVYEFTLIFLFAYSSYFLCELLELSGIMGIFFCAVGMAHYNYYNISANARIATHDGFKSIAQICDTFTFLYIGISIGISVGNPAELPYNTSLIIFTLVFCLIARSANIFLMSPLINMNRAVPIPFEMQLCHWMSGMRGSVAFALVLNLPGDNVDIIVTSTLVLIVFTTFGVGMGSLPALKAAKLTHSNIAANRQLANKRFVVKKFLAWWMVFDKNYMQKWFGDPGESAGRSKFGMMERGREPGLEDEELEQAVQVMHQRRLSVTAEANGNIGSLHHH